MALPQPTVVPMQYTVKIYPFQMAPNKIRHRQPHNFTIAARLKIVTAPLTQHNVQAKVDVILAMFYEWPHLLHSVQEGVHKHYRRTLSRKTNLRRALWCRAQREKQKRRRENQAL